MLNVRPRHEHFDYIGGEECSVGTAAAHTNLEVEKIQ